MKELKQRILESIQQTAEGCWQWTGSTASNGYGSCWWKGRQNHAHRLAYQAWVGEIPEGLQLDHLCRNRACCNPDHLEAVTGRENVLRGLSPVAMNAAKTQCVRGHAFTADNVRLDSRGNRICLVCRGIHLAALRAYMHRKRLARAVSNRIAQS